MQHRKTAMTEERKHAQQDRWLEEQGHYGTTVTSNNLPHHSSKRQTTRSAQESPPSQRASRAERGEAKATAPRVHRAPNRKAASPYANVGISTVLNYGFNIGLSRGETLLRQPPPLVLPRAPTRRSADFANKARTLWGHLGTIAVSRRNKY